MPGMTMTVCETADPALPELRPTDLAVLTVMANVGICYAPIAQLNLKKLPTIGGVRDR